MGPADYRNTELGATALITQAKSQVANAVAQLAALNTRFVNFTQQQVPNMAQGTTFALAITAIQTWLAANQGNPNAAGMAQEISDLQGQVAAVTAYVQALQAAIAAVTVPDNY
jgi:hypothetical protein